MFLDPQTGGLKAPVTNTLDYTSSFCGVDIFLLGPKLTPLADGLNGDSEVRRDQRWRLAIYGDHLSSEHAKTRLLIHIDQMVLKYSPSRVDFLTFCALLILKLRAAWSDYRWTARRVDLASTSLWPQQENHQAHRVDDAYCHLHAAIIFFGVPVLPSQCPSARPEPDLHHRRGPSTYRTRQEKNARGPQPTAAFREGGRDSFGED